MLEGTGLSPGANVQFADKVFPTDLNAGGRLQFKLPDFDLIGMPEGDKFVIVVNPDGQVSNSMTFHLDIEIVVRIKAWRVLDSEDDGTGRDDEDICEIFDHEFSPRAIWGARGIRLEFDRGPLWSEKLPAMSLSTPMVMDAGSDCACRGMVVQASMQAAEMTTTLLVMTLSVARSYRL